MENLESLEVLLEKSRVAAISTFWVEPGPITIRGEYTLSRIGIRIRSYEVHFTVIHCPLIIHGYYYRDMSSRCSSGVSPSRDNLNLFTGCDSCDDFDFDADFDSDAD